MRTRSGHQNAYIREAYRDQNGKSAKRTIEKLGNVAELEAADPAWREKAEARAAALTKAKKEPTPLIRVDYQAPATRQGAQNLGWHVLGAVWDHLKLGPWLERRSRDGAWDNNTSGILEQLVAAQILWPSSKRGAWTRTHTMFHSPQVPLAHVYQALDHIADLSETIQSRARKAITGPDEKLECVYYDVTNYFFAIDQDDDTPEGHNPPRGSARRRKGACKEHRPEQIIQMGLFMDRQGLPVSFRLFHGSSPDCVTLRAALSEFKTHFGAAHVSVVADAAMNNAANIAQLADHGDDWVFASSIRTASRKIKDWVGDGQGWQILVDEDGRVVQKTKSRLVTRTLSYLDQSGQRVKRQVQEKVVARWGADYAARQALKRGELVSKATGLAQDTSAFKQAGKRGAGKYVVAEQADPVTGEVEPACPVLSVDQARIDREAVWDGYWLLHTSRTTASDEELLDAYGQLWQIEDAFRVSKTELRARPVFVRTPEHIEAHFVVCFLALLVSRLLRNLTGVPVGQIVDRLGELSVSEVRDGYYILNRPGDWDGFDRVLGVDTDRQWVDLGWLRGFRREVAVQIGEKGLTTKHDA